MAREATEAQIARDIKEFKVSKQLLKLLNDPRSFPSWEKSKMESLLRAE